MKATIVSQETIFNMEISSTEISELRRIVSTYILTHQSDKSAKDFYIHFTTMLNPNVKEADEEKTDLPVEPFFYETYNARVEFERGSIKEDFFTDKENVRFLFGKNRQLGIEYWKEYENACPADALIWFNEHCAALILDFIQKKGKLNYKGVYSKNVRRNGAGCRQIDLYLDNSGNINYSKGLELLHHISTESLIIRKEGQEISINKAQAKLLADFLNYHLN